jgi:hypothetical protein
MKRKQYSQSTFIDCRIWSSSKSHSTNFATAFGSADGTSLTRARFPPSLLLPPFLIAFLLMRDCSM